MEEIKNQIISALKSITKEKEILLEKPPKPEMGDYAYPCFSLSKKKKKAPGAIASELDDKIRSRIGTRITTKAIGPYLNFFIAGEYLAKSIIREIHKKKSEYGKSHKQKKLVLIESPGPNTNKPLHLGHLRNILLGKSISNILSFVGKKTKIVNVVNDRGIHICKSMLAYQKFGKNKTPASADRKSDHFVGDYYVKYNQEEKKNPELEKEIQKMLIKWEKKDPETRKLWKKLNKWALQGFEETYERLSFRIEKQYFESNTYNEGKRIVLKGYKKGIFQKDADGVIFIDLENKGLGKKILLRADGTAVYIVQDLYMTNQRYDDFKFDEMIYVVGNEQEYHFKVLFEVFKKLNYLFADKCYHFSYGMVKLPEGKMKSREGSVIDADDLMDDVIDLAKEEVKRRYPGLKASEVNHRAKTIGFGAMKFSILKYDPLKNFVFNIKDSLSFEGETGPYLQYAYARICSIFKRFGKTKVIDLNDLDFSVLDTDLDKRLLMLLSQFQDKVSDAAKNHKPSLLAHYLIDLASSFSEYYHSNPILKAEPEVRNARLALIDSVRIVIKNGLSLIDIDVLEEM